MTETSAPSAPQTSNLATRAHNPWRVDIDADHACWDGLRSQGRTPDPSQVAAVQAALSARVTCVVGYAGTGKTTCVEAAVAAVCGPAREGVLILAPTGKAARRVAETSGLPARTIHRALAEAQNPAGVSPFAGLRLVVVDEAGMLDIELAARLGAEIGSSTRVLFVGDPAQLPPVGAGSVLRDLMRSGRVPVGRLEKIHRQASECGIPHVARAIRDGERGAFPGVFTPDATMLHAATDEATAETVVANVLHRVESAPEADVMVLAPQRKGDCGVEALNNALQAALNPVPERRGDYVKINGYLASEGDRVLHTRNDYERGVVNGDLGVIVEVGSEDGMLVPEGTAASQRDAVVRLVVEYPSDTKGGAPRRIAYTTTQAAEELILGYAMTCHKAQGSQAATVFVAVPQRSPVLNRNWLYTAVTRGESEVVLFGASGTFLESLDLTPNEGRRTLLVERLSAA